jgi:threonine dehydratase
MKAVRPSLRLCAASPANSAAMIASIRNGAIVETEHRDTISDGTAGGIEPGSITFELCADLIDDCFEVPEDAIKDAMRLLMEAEHMLLEGSAALGIAALLQAPHAYRDRDVVAIVSGANISRDRLREVL